MDAAVVATLEEIGGDVGEEPFDLVDPGRVGRGEVLWNRGCASSHLTIVGLLWVA